MVHLRKVVDASAGGKEGLANKQVRVPLSGTRCNVLFSLFQMSRSPVRVGNKGAAWLNRGKYSR